RALPEPRHDEGGLSLSLPPGAALALSTGRRELDRLDSLTLVFSAGYAARRRPHEAHPNASALTAAAVEGQPQQGETSMRTADPGSPAVNRRQLIGLGALGAAALALPLRRALGADQIKIAGVFGTPIEEPWVNQIHVALLKAKGELGVEYIWSENVKASDF